jgi:NADH-quinone oxidoreductase subunit N
MTLSNALTFTPQGWVLLGAVVAFILGRVRPQAEDATAVVALGAVAAGFAALLTQLRTSIPIYDGAFVVDGYTRLLEVVVLVAAAICLLLTLADRTWNPTPDFAGFLLVGTAGAMLVAGTADLTTMVIAVALLGACVALLVVAARPASFAAGAAVLALVTSVIAVALLAFGAALFYGITGETALVPLGRALAQHAMSTPALVLGLGLIVAGFGILIGIVPVQFGVTFTFQRAPLPVLAFFSGVALPALLGALTRLLAAAFSASSTTSLLIAILAAAAMSAGSLGALGERSLRRLLAYLLIGQAGYALMAATALRQGGVAAALVLIVSLAAGSLAAVAAAIGYTQRVHSDRLADLRGMAAYAPGAALVLAIALASLAGVPPLAGFFGKLLALQAAVRAGYAWLAMIGVLSTFLSVAVAVRVVREAFFEPPVFEVDDMRPHRAEGLALGLTAVAVIAMGAILGPLLSVATVGARAVLR